ncbi:MAG: hypothetical protein ACLFPX_02215 [Candidatus Omnitrophota bacterium]
MQAGQKDFLDDHLSEYEDMIRDPRYLCPKCGRPARDKDRLCEDKPFS